MGFAIPLTARINPQKRDIRLLIGTDKRSGVLGPVCQRHDNAVRTADNVIIGNDEAFRRNDNSASRTGRDVLPDSAGLNDGLRGNLHHGIRHAVYHGCHGQSARVGGCQDIAVSIQNSVRLAVSVRILAQRRFFDNGRILRDGVRRLDYT